MAVNLAQPGQVFLGEISQVRKNRVKGGACMALAQHKTVAVRVVHVLRADVHLFKIQRYKHIDDTHVAADVAALAGNYHFHYFLPQIIRQTT